jgi:hypothetical protein
MDISSHVCANAVEEQVEKGGGWDIRLLSRRALGVSWISTSTRLEED